MGDQYFAQQENKMSKERLQSQCRSLDNVPLVTTGFGSEHERDEAALAAGDLHGGGQDRSGEFALLQTLRPQHIDIYMAYIDFLVPYTKSLKIANCHKLLLGSTSPNNIRDCLMSVQCRQGSASVLLCHCTPKRTRACKNSETKPSYRSSMVANVPEDICITGSITIRAN